ncbi:hypothetical protein RUM43_006524 [Polyplax serrata]|uniref:phospholipase A2 n=1 Tax=Polyplax serrata TaxID=468196 RepID=A0AAN8S5I1_POLSC
MEPFEKVSMNTLTDPPQLLDRKFNLRRVTLQGLKLRQLTDGVHFIQLIYTFDNRVQDCEYLRQKTVIDKFLSTFRSDVNRAKITKQIDEENVIDEEEQPEEEEEEDDDSDEYLDGDESSIERYSPDLENEEHFGSEFRNVTFQIIHPGDDLPADLAEWMNYTHLKKKCRENHRILKKLAHDSRHGDERRRKRADERLARVKRGLDFSVIFPGTKWCGKSSTADKYTQLGGFFKVDKCCRAHDYCHPLIKAFETKFDYYNIRPFTISHCRCDLRRKRDIMDVLLVPGTKWCGKGRRATKYTSLGGFSRTDKCCRIHDTMCPHWIGSMEEKYGLFNWRINTIMHCRCDKRGVVGCGTGIMYEGVGAKRKLMAILLCGAVVPTWKKQRNTKRDQIVEIFSDGKL